MTDPNGIFEDHEDGGLTEFGKQLVETTVEAFEEKAAESHDELVEVFDAYMEQEVLPMIEGSVEDSVAEIRKLCLLSVSILGGQEKTREFIKRVAELARKGSLSASSGEWASGAADDAAKNLATVRGGSGTLRKEEIEQGITDYLAEVLELDELSKKTLGSYVKKAVDDAGDHAADYGAVARDIVRPGDAADRQSAPALRRFNKRKAGIGKAVDRLTKEEIEKAQALAVFNEVADGLSEEQTEEFRQLVEDMDFRGAGDGPRLRAALTEIRNRAFIDDQVSPYLAAISRTTRKS